MPYTSPSTRSAGYVVGATQWNELANNDKWLAEATTDGRPMCRAYRSTTFSVPDFTTTPVDFNTNDMDNAGCHSTTVNPSRFTAPVNGWYLFAVNLIWTPNAFGVRILDQTTNGGVNVGASDTRQAIGTFNTNQSITTFVRLDAGMYVQANAVQNSGGALNLDVATFAWFCWFSEKD